MKIRTATKQDIEWMVSLSRSKRVQYEQQQKQFWKMAENSDAVQRKFFAEEIVKENIVALCAEDQSSFIIGKIISPPEVYDAGLTFLIDDFCVSLPNLWMSVGLKLLQEAMAKSELKGVKQVLVVCGDHDLQKSQLLEKINLTVASRWYVGSMR
jgi:hypothetical protein